ncbi:MAG TPA: glycoside hydrolase family 2 TIM barrel-domain containing protein [Promineifilum sp.]|nr:glycoside hydrolase family 2 TIM barrel-domain containing protein [Promineifilum sp.]HQF69653.1 glycoside hydrolase family 2 TIM barrel-domain containing protein [Promineifilum sp.]
MDSEPFVLGVNYWPRRKAMYWWSDFDPGEVRAEFALIRELGLRLVRIFLLWDDWQPAPDHVSPAALVHLAQVMTIAADLGLKLDVTFFTGHMSGPNWSPGWLLELDKPLPARVRQLVSGGRVVDCGYRNVYTDPIALEASELLLRTVVGRFHEHPAVGLWNLGNEPDLFAWPPNAAAGREWVRRMTGLIKELDPTRPVTCGLHVDSVFRDNGLRIHDVFAEVDIPVMHGYPMYIDWLDDPLDVDFVPYLCALTTALCGKPTLMEEFGGCTNSPGEPSAYWEWSAYGEPRRQFMASEEALADYITAVLPRLVEVGATGALLWCFADYVPELWDRPPCEQSIHERFFGLVRPDGTVKPHALALQAFANTRPTVQPATRPLTLDISPEEYYRDPAGHAARLYRVFRGQS